MSSSGYLKPILNVPVQPEPDDPVHKVLLGQQDGLEAFAIKTGLTDWQTKARDHERFRTLIQQSKSVKRL